MKHSASPLRVLMGGGIASGKSLVGRRLEELGAVVVEADRLGHAVLEPDGEAFAAVSERWPSVVVDGRIHRSLLAEIVFADPGQLADLESVTHPAIVRLVTDLASHGGDLIVEVPLILDIPGDWTRVFVDADDGIRLLRAVERGGDERDIRKRMLSQPSRDEWLKWCDVTIDNSGSIEELRSQIDALWYRLRTADDGRQA
jgi:dephospho-CoA kinase